MAALQSKNTSSCSPLPSRPTNPRKSEVSNPMRRSFSGNPFSKPSIIPNQCHGFNPNTPANSPSDHPRRNSMGRDNVIVSFQDHEDKENSKDQKPKQCSVRSTASSKGTKNFMSPTISAASKINASPRKKILTERNDSVRSSVDGTGPLKENSEIKPEKSLNLKKEVSFSPTVTYLEDKEEEVSNSCEDLNSKRVAVENDLVNLDPSFEISPQASISLPSPALAPAPLDADPSMPPYDLNTNFTSPRPQFLHYKPKPIVEMYLKQRDGKPLEESFAYESSSDEQETDSEGSSLDSPHESEDVSSGNVMTEEQEEQEQEAAEQIVSEPRKVNRRHFLMRPKFTALMFVLALAGLWAFVCHSPAMEPLVLNNSNFLKMSLPPEISQIKMDNLEGLAQKFRQILYESISCIHKLAIDFIELQNPGQLQFANLTTLLEESTVDSYPLVGHNTFIAEVVYERKGQPIEAGSTFEQGPDMQQPFQNEGDELVDEFVEEGHNNDPDVSYEEEADRESEESKHEEAIAVPENEADERATEVAGGKGEESTHEEAIVVPESLDALETVTAPELIAEKSIATVSGAETEPELSSLHSPLAENAISPIESESTMADVNSESFEPEAAATVERQIAGSEDALSRHAMTGLSLLVVSSLIAVVSFVYMKNRTSGTLNASTSADHITKKVMSANAGNAVQERSCSRHWQEEVETIGESCPSEMSSFHYSSSYSKQERGESEAKSQEKRRPRSSGRREPLASSDCSMGSASYGSFTTYEKVQIKLGKGEEEFITPVRRSSRISKQVMSP